ncbi:succinate-acetate/proton symporter SatP-like, partial [Bactrocera neohumeralis]|uniref:succinate-acetate/proton symporter SatP-like n=1 Tax=Bactrocera neohumeralis TaxID=98809 RepID=UPI0021656CF7
MDRHRRRCHTRDTPGPLHPRRHSLWNRTQAVEKEQPAAAAAAGGGGGGGGGGERRQHHFHAKKKWTNSRVQDKDAMEAAEAALVERTSSTNPTANTTSAAAAIGGLALAPPAKICCCELCRPEKCKDINNSTNPRIGSPGPVTLFAFGMTTCLYNVHIAQICPMNMTTMGLIVFYGGLAQFVGGWFELINMNAFFCTLDVTYGAFWMATAITNLVPENTFVTTSDVSNNYMGGFFMLWFFFSSTMFVSSLKIGTFMQMLLNFSVALNFLLNLLGQFTKSNTLQKVAGFEGIVEGCLAVYMGMAFTLREAYGHSVLPILFQKRLQVHGV